MFSRIATGALVDCAPVGLPVRAHSPNRLPHGSVVVPGYAALAESHTGALTFDVGE